MSTTHIQKRPLAGSKTARVWEIADELLRETGTIPTGRQVVDRYVTEGNQESTGYTQYSRWKKAHTEHFKRGSKAPHAAASAAVSEPAQLVVGVDGRLLVPAQMRAAMEIAPDGKVTARVVDGELRVISPKVAIRRAQALVRAAVPEGVSMADELIAERRAEARAEEKA